MSKIQLSLAEEERLYLVAEEAAEVIQAVTKILRHGYASFNPNDQQSGTNREHLEREVGDLGAAIKMMYACRDINPFKVEQYRDAKSENVKKYLHYQR